MHKYNGPHVEKINKPRALFNCTLGLLSLESCIYNERLRATHGVVTTPILRQDALVNVKSAGRRTLEGSTCLTVQLVASPRSGLFGLF